MNLVGVFYIYSHTYLSLGPMASGCREMGGGRLPTLMDRDLLRRLARMLTWSSLLYRATSTLSAKN